MMKLFNLMLIAIIAMFAIQTSAEVVSDDVAEVDSPSFLEEGDDDNDDDDDDAFVEIPEIPDEDDFALVQAEDSEHSGDDDALIEELTNSDDDDDALVETEQKKTTT